VINKRFDDVSVRSAAATSPGSPFVLVHMVIGGQSRTARMDLQKGVFLDETPARARQQEIADAIVAASTAAPAERARSTTGRMAAKARVTSRAPAGARKSRPATARTSSRTAK
jgi:hypothetical protein